MLSINNALGILAVCASSIVVISCGDGEQATGTSLRADTGGSTAHTGGAKGIGGSSAHTGGNTSTTASTSGGSKASGGSGGIAGTSTTSVGGGTAGAAGNAGATNAGGSGTGGSATGGSPGTGGALATGGSKQTGGASSTGGTSALSCTASFAVPANNQTLTNSDDIGGYCGDGLQTIVTVATNAPTGTAATLSWTGTSGTPSKIAATTVANAVARFSGTNNAGVSLPSTGQGTLTVAIGGTACNVSETIVLNCAGAPACSITSPTITLAHPSLNGVPVAQGGDRVGSPGSPYQVAVQVSTDIQDGQPVVLTVDSSVTYQATATGGKATFAGLLITYPDGTSDGPHTISGQCTPRTGLVGSTGTVTYPVDTTAPNLTPQKGTGTGGATITALANGDHFVLADDADSATAGLQIKFCGTTTQLDGINVPTGNPNVNNFCAAVGGNTPICAAATGTGGSGGACINIACPGNGPFDVNLTLKDAAGNPTTVTRTNLTCASTSPTVSFVEPLSDVAPFNDVSKRILATTNTNTGVTRKDKNATTPGAQYDVIACTSAPTGSTATLSTGYMGQALTQAATITVFADANNQCAGGNLAPFYNATLPESLTDSSFNLATATELSVTVTDLNLASGTATADVWVDSTSPTLTLMAPTGLCGSYINTSGTGNTTASVNMTFGSSIPVVVTVQGPNGQATFNGNTVTASQVVVSGVALDASSDTVSAIATKPSTNFGTFGSCTVAVGDTPPPTVTWQSPIATSLLTAAGNPNSNAIADNSATAGWQGTLAACTNIDTTANPGATIQFSANGTNIGSPIAIDATSKCATVGNATVPDGAAVLLTATTSPIAGNSGVASITVPVDTTIPGAP